MSIHAVVRGRVVAAWLATALLAACGQDKPTAGPADGAIAEDAPPTVAEPELAPDIAIPESGVAPIVLAKWTGDLDGMVERRYIRVLTTYSKTHFFIDRGTARGLVPDAFKMFEDDLNKRLKNKHLRVSVVFVPVAHDESFDMVEDGPTAATRTTWAALAFGAHGEALFVEVGIGAIGTEDEGGGVGYVLAGVELGK